MKRRSILGSIAMPLALALSLGACAPAKEAPAKSTPQPVVEITAAPEIFEVPATALPAAPAEAADGTVYEKLCVMTPVLDSLVRTIGIAGETVYAPQDAAFVWNYLYLMGENYGGTHPLVTVEGDKVTVPKRVMESFAGAAFAGMAALPEQPEESKEIAVYDATQEVYRLAPSDAGAAEAQLERWYALNDGTVIAVAGLYNVDERLGELRFMLINNSDGDSVYPYAVQSAVRNTADSPIYVPLSMTEENSFDIDNDGAADVIAFEVGNDDDVTMQIRLGSGETLTERFEYLYNASAHIGDANVHDQPCELYLCGDTGSDDYVTYIYRINDGALEKAEIWGSVAGMTGEGEVVIDTVVDVLGTYGGLCRYRLADDAFRFDLASAYVVSEYDWDTRALTTKKDGLPVTSVATGKAYLLPVGTKLLLLATDKKSFARLELSDGSQVTVSLRENETDWGFSIDNTAESEWFGELLYAG